MSSFWPKWSDILSETERELFELIRLRKDAGQDCRDLYRVNSLLHSCRIEVFGSQVSRNQAQHHVEHLKLEVLELRQLLAMVIRCNDMIQVRTLCSHYGVIL